MAVATYSTTLKTKASPETEFSVLVPVKDYPNLGGEPEMLETTTLSDAAQTYIPGIQTMEVMQFTANYTLDDYKKVKALENKDISFRIEFGADGVDGVYEWDGRLSVYVTGKGVNEVREMIISVAPSTEVELVTTP